MRRHKIFMSFKRLVFIDPQICESDKVGLTSKLSKGKTIEFFCFIST